MNSAALAGLEERRLYSGKVRELYAAGDGQMVMVATDRISVYDYILPSLIPDKGAVLTGLSLWWFEQLADIVPNHVISADVADFPAAFAPFADALRGRAVLVKALDMVTVECVARGYLAGSGVSDYQVTGAVCGVPLPPGLADGSRLPDPIFTPTTKAPVGEHDEAMTYAEVVDAVGAALADELRTITLEVYTRGRDLAGEAGIILADTKVELGHDSSGVLVLGDEVLTPDSSRFWPTSSWDPGGPQVSYDKQFVRDWLRNESGWDRTGSPPAVPDAVIEKTRTKYVECFERLTGTSFAAYLGSA